MTRGSAEHRAILDWLTQALDRGLETAVGQPVQEGLRKSFEPTDLERRPLPIRVVVVEYTEGYVSDVLIAISNLEIARIGSLLSTVALSIGEQLGVDCQLGPPQAYEFDDRDEADEQLQALFGSDSIRFDTPDGTMLMVMGTRLVNSSGDVLVRSGKLRELLGEEVTDGDGEPEIDEGEFSVEWSPDDTELVVESEVPTFGNDELGVTTAIGPEAAAAPAPVAVDPEPEMTVARSRWSRLLTDVDVQLSAEFGSTNMRLGELASLRGDSVLSFDQMIDDPITVHVNGAPYATARLVVIDDEYGIEIVEVLAPTAAQSGQYTSV